MQCVKHCCCSYIVYGLAKASRLSPLVVHQPSCRPVCEPSHRVVSRRRSSSASRSNSVQPSVKTFTALAKRPACLLVFLAAPGLVFGAVVRSPPMKECQPRYRPMPRNQHCLVCCAVCNFASSRVLASVLSSASTFTSQIVSPCL